MLRTAPDRRSSERLEAHKHYLPLEASPSTSRESLSEAELGLGAKDPRTFHETPGACDEKLKRTGPDAAPGQSSLTLFSSDKS